MREILFRGKRIDNGEWIYGMPWIFKDKSCICPWNEGMCKYDTGYYPVEVIPETVGQYTGLTDKNKTKIFEGDIVFVGKNKIPLYIEFTDSQKDSPYLSFSWNCRLPNKPLYLHRLENDSSLYEVIGNIHDNPELLEVKE